MAKIITLNFDGSCEPQNPGGNMGYGTLVKYDGRVLYQNTECVPAAPTNSNNVAEYMSLVRGLEWLIANKYQNEPIIVRGDSQLVIRQMAGDWRAKGGMYFTAYKQAVALAAQFTDISFEWIPRAENIEADNLSRSAEPVPTA